MPNRFPDAGETPEYNTADASLWFFIAMHAYLRASGDRTFAAEIYPTLKEILDWHMRGTRFGIRMDQADALLRAGEDGVQLTWMDAKVGDWVVTPRIGKPVEINALWFNAVCILRDLAGELDHPRIRPTTRRWRGRIRASFEQAFWFEAGGYLYDVIDGPEGDTDAAGRRRDASLRPNQLFALSLPHALVSGEKAKTRARDLRRGTVDTRGLALARRRAIRATSGRYGGGPRERDGAYHQGTVWTWLLGPVRDARTTACMRTPPAALEFLRATSRRTCAKGVSARSAKSWMGTHPSNPAAASRRPGAWPKSCGPGVRSMKANDGGKPIANSRSPIREHASQGMSR